MTAIRRRRGIQSTQPGVCDCSASCMLFADSPWCVRTPSSTLHTPAFNAREGLALGPKASAMQPAITYYSWPAFT